jgi:D-proline reductase (dithiol) PrdB
MKQRIEQQIEAIKATLDPEFRLAQNEFIPWTPWNTPPVEAKVSLVTTGGVYLHKGLNQPFETANDDSSFREFPSITAMDDLIVAEAEYDLRYGKADVNVLFPMERMQELVAGGYIGSLAPFTYSFRGQIRRPVDLAANYAPSVAYRMRRMGVEVVLVIAAGDLLHHQTAALIARSIELAGVPTILLGTDSEAAKAVGVPRAVVVHHPHGAPLGNPGNVGKHHHLLREVFDSAWQFEGPGLVAELPFTWGG